MERTGRAEEWSRKARPRRDAALPIGDVGFESRLVDVDCCDDIATESEEDMNIDIATITFPTCGADADSLCFYPGEAFCMNCGEVFDLTENARDSRELIKNSIN